MRVQKYHIYKSPMWIRKLGTSQHQRCPIYKEYLNHPLGLTLSTPGLVRSSVVISSFKLIHLDPNSFIHLFSFITFSLQNWKKIKNALQFIKWVSSYTKMLSISSLSSSLCKGDKRNSLIEPLPSSFSNLYSRRPENIGFQIPTKDQEVEIKKCVEYF